MNAVSLRSIRLCALIASTGVALFLSPTVHAQVGEGEKAPDALPPEHYSVSPGGVDMRSGQFTYSHVDLAMGGENGLSLVRDNGPNKPFFDKFFGNFDHNWDIHIHWKLEGSRNYNGDTGQFEAGTGYQFSVTAGGRSQSFTYQYLPTTGIIPSVTSDAKLATSSSGDTRQFTYTAPDGTVIEFPGTVGCPSGPNIGGTCAAATSVVQPDGVRYDLDYSSGLLRRVTSNRGYALLFEYGSSAGARLVTKACVINLASSVAPADNICPAGARSATYTYSANGHLASYTDPTGATHSFESTYIDTANPWLVKFFNPGESTPYLTNSVVLGTGVTPRYEMTTSQTFADGRTFTYTWNEVEHSEMSWEVAGGNYTRNGGATVTVGYDTQWGPPKQGKRTSPGPSLIVDELGRQTTGSYCVAHPVSGCTMFPIQQWTHADGAKTAFQYSGHKVIETRQIAKPGSGLADIVTTAGYSCASPAVCAKPIWTKNGNLNQTDYTYDLTHGGVLTETGPAAPNGVRPQKRYTYAQRTAWISNGSGGYVAVSPIWVLTQESFCKTGAASGAGCAVAGDEVVTTYDYGPNSGPNNLNLRGKVVDAGGLNLRTCYGYDTFGNKISETAPRAGLTACP